MKLSTQSTVPVYTIAGASTARPLPEWLARKRKRSLKKDPEYANRVELLQDFEFEEASQCVRVSSDGDWIMSTGTYKPQIHVHYLPHLSLSYARHTNTINEKFVLLSSDYTKSLHLQTDRFLEFHSPGNLHYSTRIPRYGRDLVYNSRTTEALVPAVGVNADGSGEVFRLNLEVGRFMKGYEVDVGDDVLGGGTNQGGVQAGAVNCAAVAEESHGLMAFGTILGTVEFWDQRSRSKICVLGSPSGVAENTAGVTALAFHRSGLQIATGTELGMCKIYDLRSPVPLIQKDQGYDFPIKTLQYLTPSTTSRGTASEEKIMSADKRIIKIWDAQSGEPWTSVEPVVDLNHVEWVPDSGMLLTANEGRQQHSFLIPQLGPAPRWCAFLDNLVEEMAEDAGDPNAYTGGSLGNRGEVYDNYKFLDPKQLRELNLEHLVGRTTLLRPYMHGFFVSQQLYEQARLISNPDLFAQQRQKSIQERIDKERESRVRGNKKVSVKVNRKLAESLVAREEASQRRKAQRVLRQGGDEAPAADVEGQEVEAQTVVTEKRKGLMEDDRFSRLFQDEDFEIDEASHEFAMHNPSSVSGVAKSGAVIKRGLTAVEEEALEEKKASDNEDDDSEDDDEAAEIAARAQQRRIPEDHGDKRRIGSTDYKRSGQRREPQMKVSNTKGNANKFKSRQHKSFGDRAADQPVRRERKSGGRREDVVGEREVTFVPQKKSRKQEDTFGKTSGSFKDRRSASGNVFRKM
ncbi:hypothetical protein AMS68_007023 [Peltaster fructicola]|uniref:Uncharacterized protein n=1 Tax=Peltaster fructicola TaxID=286661 RepID=A0A6H0Y3H8_9PEZI|nr:hypothetical protein AMS68_007023 [Peltaster fructicola]